MLPISRVYEAPPFISLCILKRGPAPNDTSLSLAVAWHPANHVFPETKLFTGVLLLFPSSLEYQCHLRETSKNYRPTKCYMYKSPDFLYHCRLVQPDHRYTFCFTPVVALELFDENVINLLNNPCQKIVGSHFLHGNVLNTCTIACNITWHM